MFDQLIILVVCFFIYSFFGWLWESLILPLAKKQRPYNRGFLNGPWIPIYGFGAILVIILFDIRQVNYPAYSLFVNGGFVACLLEYVTSYVMEKLFHHRWWDYSQRPFNINGRVCLEGFVCFGLFSLLAIDVVQPFFVYELSKIDQIILFFVSVLLTVFFVLDTIVSTKAALVIDEKIALFKEHIEEKEAELLESLQEKQLEVNQFFKGERLLWKQRQIVVRNMLRQKDDFKFSQRHLIKAFPDLLKRNKED